MTLKSFFVMTLSATLLQTASDFDVADQAAFQKLIPKAAKVQKVAGDQKFVEGPVWTDETDGGYLVFSDIPSSELKHGTRRPASRGTFRYPSGEPTATRSTAKGGSSLRLTRTVSRPRGGKVSRSSTPSKARSSILPTTSS